MQDVSESGVASKPAYNNKINSPDKLRAAAAAAELESSYFFGALLLLLLALTDFLGCWQSLNFDIRYHN